MKFAIQVLVAAVVACQLANAINVDSYPFAYPPAPAKSVGISFCKTCIDFADQALNELLNAVLNLGIVGSCNALCSYIEQKTGIAALGIVCDLLCDYEGITEFIKIIEKADLDPIYYCELLKACEIKDDGDAHFTSFTVSPKSGPQGDFTASLQYVTKNGTGTGMLALEIKAVDGIPLGTSFLNMPQAPGMYQENIKINATPDPDCDPSQGPCEQWLPGTYTILVALCNGECGSHHPHSQIYDTAQTTWTITG